MKNTDTERRDCPKPKVLHHAPRSTMRRKRYEIPAYETIPISKNSSHDLGPAAPVRPDIGLLMPLLISMKLDLLVHPKQEGASGRHDN